MISPVHVTRPEALGKRLEITRLALGLDQKTFYAPTRLGSSAYSMWESGARYPRVEHIMLLCTAYGLTLDWIYRGDLSSLSHRLVLDIQKIISSLRETGSEISNLTNGETGS
ncbi:MULTISPECIES: helix-turn-helix domain-containing protein [Rhodomicrobium]|uniref:helix-turn-helix domain-containing protein n=1 Tax=Rhodomicrobium vannielii TaxID=1069 RepID=UPI000B4A731B